MADNLRNDILKTSTRLFFKYGLRSVTIEDICNELRISKKTFYTCFSQKEALIDDILSDYDDTFSKRMEIKHKSLLQQESATVIDIVLAFSFFHLMNRDAQFENLFFDMRKYYPEVLNRHKDRNRSIVTENISKMLARGISEGLYREDIEVEITAGIISLQLMSAMEYAKDNLSKSDQQKAIILITDLILRSLCNEEGLQYYLKALEKLEQNNIED